MKASEPKVNLSKQGVTLERCQTYEWTVTAFLKDRKTESTFRFRVIDSASLQRVKGIESKRAQRYLHLGVFYFQEGLLDEAVEVLKHLENENTEDIKAARQLRDQIAKMRLPKDAKASNN